jgi:DNA-binding MarR family transcriptional regulator
MATRKRASIHTDSTQTHVATPSAPSEANTQFLETLLGYNARRAALTVIDVFLDRMSIYGLRPVDFSVLSIILHTPGVTSKQLCDALGILTPNLVRIISNLDSRGLLRRKPHPKDGRAIGLHLTAEGIAMMKAAEKTVRALEDFAASGLTASERETLMRLLKKIYKR